MGKNTIRYSVYAAVMSVILTLTGIFSKFGGRQVLVLSGFNDSHFGISLSLVLLTLMLGVTAYIVASSLEDRRASVTVLNGVISSLIVAVALAALVLFQNAIGSMRFVFENLQTLAGSELTSGYVGDQLVVPGLLSLLVFAAIVGAFSGFLVSLNGRLRQALLLGLIVMTVVGLLRVQVENVITLSDSIVLILAFGISYTVMRFWQLSGLLIRLALGFGIGAVIGILTHLLITPETLREMSWLLGLGDVPHILGLTMDNRILLFIFIFGGAGATGSLISSSPRFFHHAMFYLMATLFIIGLLNYQDGMTNLVILMTLVVVSGVSWFSPQLAISSESRFVAAPPLEQTATQGLSVGTVLFIMLIAPIFLGLNITNVLDTVMLFIIMGIGLNVMVGFAGLLDLGYVASFAIGAYTVGLLTTPSIITTGCAPIEAVEGYRYIGMCTGIATDWPGLGLFTFWTAIPIAIIVSASTGMALGVPVLRLRGDYLAIVTLGFGEIVRIMVGSDPFKDLFGGPRGVTEIPVPVINLSFLQPSDPMFKFITQSDFLGGILARGHIPTIHPDAPNPDLFFQLSSATSIYYLYLFAVILTAFIVLRLAGSRLGRAWRAMRADEDVAEATGIHLIRTKLMAFGVSSAFAGLGGGIFVTLLRGAVPTSFDLEVSINVLSLILVGGLGSIPGIILGAFVLVGLPEVLREFAEYRLFFFGVLLVVVMLSKPEGLLPPRPRELSQLAHKHPAEKGANNG